MDDELNLRLLGAMIQSSYVMQAREKYRGQGRLLILLHIYGALTQRELIELTGRRSATLSEQLDGMERAGLINRCKHAQDRRNVDVTLTPRGETAALQAIGNRQQYADEILGGLSDVRKRQLLDIMDELLAAWGTPVNPKEYECREEDTHGCE